MTELDVCAAVIRRGQRLLLATRPAGTHLAGKWEFPGGKRLPEESLEECIVREIREELGVTVRNPILLCRIRHTYPAKTIRLQFLGCELSPDAEPHGHDGQEWGWYGLPEMPALDLAGADAEFLRRLTAPPEDDEQPAWRNLRRALSAKEFPPCPPASV